MCVAGACTKCMHNTSGMKCDECKKGYVGDPFVFKNCTLRGNKSTITGVWLFCGSSLWYR